MITIHASTVAFILLCAAVMVDAPLRPWGRSALRFWLGLSALALYVVSIV